MQITISKGGSARDRSMFIADVKFIPGVGPRNAAAIYDGTPLTIIVPADKRETTERNLRRMMLDGTLIVQGLNTEIPAPWETSTETKQEVNPVHINPVPAGIDATLRRCSNCSASLAAAFRRNVSSN